MREGELMGIDLSYGIAMVYTADEPPPDGEPPVRCIELSGEQIAAIRNMWEKIK